MTNNDRMMALIVSPNYHDRLQAAGNPLLTGFWKLVLAKDREWSVRSVIAGRADLPREIIDVIFEDEENEWVLSVLAERSDLTFLDTARLLAHPSPLVREAIEENLKHQETRAMIMSKTPKSIVNPLFTDVPSDAEPLSISESDGEALLQDVEMFIGEETQNSTKNEEEN
jgi:hypothetical protein